MGVDDNQKFNKMDIKLVSMKKDKQLADIDIAVSKREITVDIKNQWSPMRLVASSHLPSFTAELCWNTNEPTSSTLVDAPPPSSSLVPARESSTRCSTSPSTSPSG